MMNFCFYPVLLEGELLPLLMILAALHYRDLTASPKMAVSELQKA